MASQLQRQIAELKKQYSESTVDIACQLRVYEQKDGVAVPTEKTSRVYGGKYHIWTRQKIGEADEIVELSVSQRQFDCLTDPKKKKMGLGGRGGGKSEMLDRWAMIKVCEHPDGSIMLMSPTYKKAKILWFGLLRILPESWFRPGQGGIRKSDREFWFRNGCVIRFFSADNPDAVRGEGVHAVGIDERQDVVQEAVDNAFLTMRKTAQYELLQIGTPKMGTDFHAEYERYDADKEAGIYPFPSMSNPFIPLGKDSVFSDAAKNMDSRRYRQEVLAEFCVQEGVVYYPFRRHLHVKDEPPADTLVTRQVTQRRFKRPVDYVVGMDFNLDPLTAVVMVITGRDTVHVIDEIVLNQDASTERVIQVLKERGYNNSVVCPDASSESHGGKSNSRFLNQAGFFVSVLRKNPPWQDRINSINGILKNQNDDIRLYVSPKCPKLIKAFESQQLKRGEPDKRSPHDHIMTALGYAVHRLYPAGKVGTGIKIIHA